MSREYEQPSSFHRPIQKDVIDHTLDETSLKERLKETVYIRDILECSHDDAIATWLIEYSSAIVESLCSSDAVKYPHCENTFMIGSLLMYHLKNNQDLKDKNESTRLSLENLPEYTESLFPIEFGGTRSRQMRDHNDVLIRAIQYGNTWPNKDYVKQLNLYRNQPKIVEEAFVWQFDRHRREFESREPLLFELSKDETMQSLSNEHLGAFWSGLISTYYLLKTDEELNQLENILRER